MTISAKTPPKESNSSKIPLLSWLTYKNTLLPPKKSSPFRTLSNSIKSISFIRKFLSCHPSTKSLIKSTTTKASADGSSYPVPSSNQPKYFCPKPEKNPWEKQNLQMWSMWLRIQSVKQLPQLVSVWYAWTLPKNSVKVKAQQHIYQTYTELYQKERYLSGRKKRKVNQDGQMQLVQVHSSRNAKSLHRLPVIPHSIAFQTHWLWENAPKPDCYYWGNHVRQF